MDRLEGALESKQSTAAKFGDKHENIDSRPEF